MKKIPEHETIRFRRKNKESISPLKLSNYINKKK